ncbi:hypothetical protein HPB47_016410 [Ixodes persulcatus]|uniref:Uncharacterized protein n=1 Tax=Ixodes persulcatus TaxID=34615 RepID=A0AC60R081_IXOPE|nr:hypothetical protein HPB47_016410 [Ixodes persulcatus]
MAVYADYVALLATSPPNRRQEMVKELQRALTNTVRSLHKLGLGISAEKTTALFQASILRTFRPVLHIEGAPINSETTAAYLGLMLDARVSWRPAVDAVLQKMRTRTSTLRAIGGTTWGTSQAMMLAMYKDLVVSCPTYALPLVTAKQHTTRKPREGAEGGTENLPWHAPKHHITQDTR